MVRKLAFQAQILNRDSIISDIKNLAFLKDIICDIHEDRGWIKSDYRIRLSGNDAEVLKLQALIKEKYGYDSYE